MLKAGGPSVDQQAREVVEDAGLIVTHSEQERLANARRYRPRVLHADPRTISHRWPYAVMRIARILESAARTPNLEHAVRDAEYSALAKEYVETWAYYMTRTRPAPLRGTDHNPFRHMSDVDAARMFVRRVEDICDRSTGKLGSWCTK